MCFPTGSASDVHGFEIACFDDAHSDGVGCGVVAQRHQQVPSASLEKLNATAKRSGLYILCSLHSISLDLVCFFFVSSADCLWSLLSTCQPLHIPVYLLLYHQHAATSPPGASRQPGMTSPITFCPISHLPSSPHPPPLTASVLCCAASYSHCHRCTV